MFELRDIYQEVILDHNRSPRNRGVVADATHHAEGFNPLCGDQITVTLRVENGRIMKVAFEGHGCAISTASSSLMTEAMKGMTINEAEALFEAFHNRLIGNDGAPATPEVDLGKLEAFDGVKEYPIRVKCATLPWHTLIAALRQSVEPVSTE